ncbi:hypothetical protein E2C01_093899 [Portunus trituberculatus]|uniref:Secreted protein n=1 Tax=Portunus trituberculatus TaxID=210409 RepID=A0A5B7JW40_PORTR|nr:hypothetical protein [Portunus trituberculatus]
MRAFLYLLTIAIPSLVLPLRVETARPLFTRHLKHLWNSIWVIFGNPPPSDHRCCDAKKIITVFLYSDLHSNRRKSQRVDVDKTQPGEPIPHCLCL